MGLQAVARATADDLVRIRLRNEARALDGVIDDLRSYVCGLAPGVLSDRDLAGHARGAAEGFTEVGERGRQVTVDDSVAVKLESAAGPVVQMANEALSNIARHAQASRVTLTLGRTGADAVFEVSDDGCGFDPAAMATRGHGLRNFVARVESIGGRLRLDSAPGKGTAVRVQIPRILEAEPGRPWVPEQPSGDRVVQLPVAAAGTLG
jgi:signal transduction histidine kinase